MDNDPKASSRELEQRKFDHQVDLVEQRSKAEKYYEQAIKHYNMQEYDDALMMIRSALGIHPTNWKYHYNLAYIYTLVNNEEVGIHHYKMFLRYAEPEDPDIEAIKGRIQYLEAKVKAKYRR